MFWSTRTQVGALSRVKGWRAGSGRAQERTPARVHVLAAGFREPVPQVTQGRGAQTLGCCSQRMRWIDVVISSSAAVRMPTEASRRRGGAAAAAVAADGRGGLGVGGWGGGGMSHVVGIPLVGAGRERPPAAPRGEGVPRQLQVRSGMVWQDVEQVQRRHANLYVPAQARIAELGQRAWVQSHLWLTLLHVSAE